MKKKIDILVELRKHIAKKYTSQAEAARMWGVSSAMVSGVLTGKKPPTAQMLEDAGFRKIPAKPTYERVS